MMDEAFSDVDGAYECTFVLDASDDSSLNYVKWNSSPAYEFFSRSPGDDGLTCTPMVVNIYDIQQYAQKSGGSPAKFLVDRCVI